MTSETEKLDTLLRALIHERPEFRKMALPTSIADKRNLLRCLMNVRPPEPLADDLMRLQDEELALQRDEKGVVSVDSLTASPLYPHIYLWQGDITRLKVDAIVNAANSRMLGCFVPIHKCIDNAIHSAAGMELREECNRIMLQQGHEEPTGKAKITPGYNLPAKYVIHTVGPIVYGSVPTEEDCRLLADCYYNCLELAAEHGVKSIAFCCISTGEFRFPQMRAAEIAAQVVTDYLKCHSHGVIKKMVFNVFKDSDLKIYRKLLGYE